MLNAFAFVFVLGWIVHMVTFSRISEANTQSILDRTMAIYFSIQYSLEMFVGKTLIFRGDIRKVIDADPVLGAAFITTFFMAVTTSAIAIFHFISRIAYGRRWLHNNTGAAMTGDNHIFAGICEASRTLAANIRKEGTEGKIIFIDIPDSKELPKGLSVWDIISRFFNDDNHDDLNADVVLRAGKRMKGIIPWLRSSRNNLYILSDNQDENLKMLERIWQLEDSERHGAFGCRIYCHAVKEGLVSRYDTVTDVHNRTTFVDSSFLAIESLKDPENKEMYPINYVRVGTDQITGRKTGWVASDFNCAILGFGETGQEALKFLYEFGAFVGEDRQKVPFRCHIIDKNPDDVFGEFKRRIQLVHKDEVQFTQCAAETAGFWHKIDEIINDINYIVVCLGDDMTNLKVSLDIAELALQKGRDIQDRFVIAVRQREFSKLDKDTLLKANKTFCNCIRPFGMSDEIWKLRVMGNMHINEMARKFYCSYMGVDSDEKATKAWYDRERLLRDDDFKTRSKARRQIAQDYSNCLHAITKQALCDTDTAEAARFITDICEGGIHVDQSSCSESDETVLEYLAIGEHLRWNASHIMLGYRYSEATCDLKKTHNCLVPYSELDDNIRHFDWLVVRNSLRSDNKAQFQDQL